MEKQPVTRETDKNRLKQPVKSEIERERHGEKRRSRERETETCDGGLQTHLPARNDIY